MSEKAKRDTSPTRKMKKKSAEEVKAAPEVTKVKRNNGNRNASKAIEQEVRINTAIMLLRKDHADLALEVLTAEYADDPKVKKNSE